MRNLKSKDQEARLEHTPLTGSEDLNVAIWQHPLPQGTTWEGRGREQEVFGTVVTRSSPSASLTGMDLGVVV